MLIPQVVFLGFRALRHRYSRPHIRGDLSFRQSWEDAQRWKHELIFFRERRFHDRQRLSSGYPNRVTSRRQLTELIDNGLMFQFERLRNLKAGGFSYSARQVNIPPTNKTLARVALILWYIVRPS